MLMPLYSVRVDGGGGAWLHQAHPGGHGGVSERGRHDAAAEGDDEMMIMRRIMMMTMIMMIRLSS